MRIFSYRNKRAFKRTLLIAGGAALLLLALCISRFVYLQRYITYTDDGAKLNYDQHIEPSGTQPAELDPEQYPFEIIVDTGSDDPAEADAQKQFSGYYITTNMLAKDVQAVRDALDSLDGLTTVMIDVKSVFGYYYYSSEQPGAETADADIAAVDKLISDLTKRSGLTVIAHVPAFSDPLFAFDHQSDSLAMYSGALWMDDRRCYWMNPNSSAVQGFLSSIAIELSDLGFDEVVFDDFYFPDSEAIAWNGSVSKGGCGSERREKHHRQYAGREHPRQLWFQRARHGRLCLPALHSHRRSHTGHDRHGFHAGGHDRHSRAGRVRHILARYALRAVQCPAAAAGGGMSRTRACGHTSCTNRLLNTQRPSESARPRIFSERRKSPPARPARSAYVRPDSPLPPAFLRRPDRSCPRAGPGCQGR